MEETLGNVGGCRAIFERWMEWEPEDQYWLTFINFELRLVSSFWQCPIKKTVKDGGSALHRGSILASRPAAPCLIPNFPQKKFSGKIVDVVEVNRWCWLDENGQRLENVYRTHLVLASGKSVLQFKLWTVDSLPQQPVANTVVNTGLCFNKIGNTDHFEIIL